MVYPLGTAGENMATPMEVPAGLQTSFIVLVRVLVFPFPSVAGNSRFRGK